MSEKLEIYHSQMRDRPTLSHTNGMVVVVIGGCTVQFDRDASALFFAEAHREVPALCARVRELEAQVAALGQGELEAVRRELARVTGERDAAYERSDDMHDQLEAEVKARTLAEQRARERLRFRDVAAELARRALAAEDELAKARNSAAESTVK